MRRKFTASRAIAIAIVMMPVAVLGERRAHSPTTRDQQPAAVCLGIVVPASEGIKGDATQVERAARDLLIGQLTDPSLKILPLEARLRAPATEEARKAECGNLLMIALKQKSGESGVRGLAGKVAEGAGSWAGWSVPAGGVAGAATRGAALAGAAAVASLASSTNAQDELRIDYEVVGTSDGSSTSPQSPQSERLKARANGEDLLTPLMRRVAERVHATVATR
jgi:hypothetical protein